MKLGNDIAAIITGGASGMGYATAQALAAQGVKVALFDKNAEIGDAQARAVGGVFCHVDITDEVSLDNAFAKAREAHGQERILVNCAGGSLGAMKTVTRNRETGSIDPYPIARYRWVIELNLVGTFACITKSTAGMLELEPLEDGERGAIVNTASVAAEEGQIGQIAYASAKAGVVGLTLTVARDFSSEGIRCNTILPGIFDTPMVARASPKQREMLESMIPFPKRLGRAEEYAQLALTMITNNYFNGEDVRLDGAVRMSPR